MSQPRRPVARRLVAVGAVGCTVLLGGCVYLRLLELKFQLDKFDRNFAVRTADGLAIICHKPVMRTGDVRWFGVMPERVERLGHAEQWLVRWVKQLPPGVTETPNHDLLLELGFADDKLNRVGIPESYFAVMPKEFLVGVLKSFGQGQINQGGKTVETSVAAPEIAAARPKLPGLDKLLGVPTDRRVESETTILRYRYRPVTQEKGAGDFDMILHFDTARGILVRWQAVTPVGKIGFNFGKRR